MNARAGLLATSIAALLAAAGWAGLVERTRPHAVLASVVARVGVVVPGATVEVLAPDRVQVTTVSGVNVELRLASVQIACLADRWRCGTRIVDAADDVLRALALIDHPKTDDLRPVVTGEGGPGYRFGYVTEPLIGALEIRYALVSGVASTFVTEALADRIAPSRDDLKRLALEGQARDGEPDLAPIAGSSGPLYQVVARGDPVAALLDHSRMRTLAKKLGTARLYCARPSRDELIVAPGDEEGRKALDRQLDPARLVPTLRAGAMLMLYDTDAPAERALTLVAR